MTVSYVDMHRLFRRLQQRNRFIGPASHTGLSPAETHFLLELDADGGRSISDLSALLDVDPSFASRLSSGLTRKQLVKTAPSESDGRRKKLLITAKGRAMIALIDKVANARFELFAKNLPKSTESRLARLLRAVADGYGHPPGIRRAGDNEYRVELRRITRCFGMLGDHVFGSTFPSSAWQLLAEVVLSPVAPQPGELARLLAVAQNSLSPQIARMESEGLMDRRQDPHDKRIVSLRSREKGRREYFEIENAAVLRLRRALADISPRVIEEGLDTFHRFIGSRNPALPPLIDVIEVVRAADSHALSRARGFVARGAVKARFEDELPERFVSRDEAVYDAVHHGRHVAVFALDPADGSVRTAGWDADKVSPWTLLAVLSQIYERAEYKDFEFKPAVVQFAPLRRFFGFELE